MNTAKFKGFAVIAFSQEKLRGAVFRRLKTKHELVRHCSLVPDPADPAKTWKELFHLLAVSRDEPLFLCGALKKSFFFRTRMAEIPVRAIRSALALELPRRRLSTGQEEESLIQFSLPGSEEERKSASAAKNGEETENSSEEENGEIKVNACVFPASSLEELSAILLQCGRKADMYVYPFLALQDSDPALHLPDVEKNFYFAADSWQVVSGGGDDPAGTNGIWEKIFAQKFELPSDLPVKEFFSLLLCARYFLTPAFASSEDGLDVLPAKLRPSRLKPQLKLGAILLVLILFNALWSCSGQWLHNFREYKLLSREKAALAEENRKLSAKIRKVEKDGKERQKYVPVKAGEHEIVRKLHDLTDFLPSSVMVSSMRWSDSGVDLTMFSEESLNISETFRTRFPYWKLANIQQRNFGGAATMITVRLTNSDESASPERERGRRR